MSTDKKSNILYLKKILEERTDEGHPLSTSQLMDILQNEYGVSMHRQTFSSCIKELIDFGVDICKTRTNENKYFIGQRTFETPELKLLIDAIESSRFITASKSEELIDKICLLTSYNLKDNLKRHTFSINRIKQNNEKIYYIVDSINDAINSGKQISFKYYTYNEKKEKILKNDGETYFLSPYTLVWNEDYYYVVGYSVKHRDIVNFRVDRIESTPTILEDNIINPPENFDMPTYIKNIFSMYAGESSKVELVCDNSLMKTMIDRFGEDITIKPYNADSFKMTVEISASQKFYGWVFGFAGKVKIIGPKEILYEYQQMLSAAST